MIPRPEDGNPGRHSATGILIGNLFTVAIALWQGWDLAPMMAVYWCQSVIIGVFNFARMLLLKRFCTEGFTSNGRPVPETAAGKRSTALFFAVHFGFFHLGYLVFLFAQGAWTSAPGDTDLLWIGSAVGAFLLAHAFSFRQNVAADLRGKPNLGTMMFLPYARVVPMHLTIVLGASLVSGPLGVLFFSGLKILADLLMHHVEHRVLQKHLRKFAVGSGEAAK